MFTAENLPTLIATASLMLLLGLESWLPAVVERRQRLRHVVRNLGLAGFNALIMALLLAPLIRQGSAWAESSGVGLLRLVAWPTVPAYLAAFLLFDGWMYLWHRANHQFSFLWRFHRVHHSDPAMDVTTAIRFHPGELLISTALRLAVIPLLGISLYQLLVYEMVLLPVILFHHSNVQFPERGDRWLRWLLVTPALHRVHHSRLRNETDSNYASVFSAWDRLAGTSRLRQDGQPVNFGLAGCDGEEWQGLSGLLTTPFSPSEIAHHSVDHADGKPSPY